MKNILITGGAGFIGSHLALELSEKGYQVTVMDNLSEQIHGKNPELQAPMFQKIKSKTRFLKGSVTNRDDWEKSIEGQDVIVHLAAETGTGQSMYKIKHYNEVNVLGTAIMLERLMSKKHTVQKIVVASSRALYGEGKYQHPDLGVVYPEPRKVQDMISGDFEVKYHDSKRLTPLPTDENSKIHPSSIYGITKQNQEQMIFSVCQALGIIPVALRYQNVYGVGQSLLNPYTGILSIFSTQILRNNAVNIFEDGKETRDFVYIDDAVKATILCIESDFESEKIYNVGTGIATRVTSVAEQLKQIYNSNSSIAISGQFRIGDIRHNFADIAKIQNELHFKPQYSFEKGIEKFAKWVMEQQIQDNNFDNSIQELIAKGMLK